MRNNIQKIPAHWEWTTMGEISNVVGGGTPKTSVNDNFDGGKIPWITPADLSGYAGKYIGHGSRNITEKGLNSSSARLMPKGSVLFSSRAPIGYVAIAQNQLCTNQGFKSFILHGNEIIPDYVYWYLKGNKELAQSLASGTTFLELSGAKAKQIFIPIAPKNEQKRIVAEIEKQFSRLDEAVESLRRVKANLKRYKASVLKAAVEGKLTEKWRAEHPDVEPASKLLERILTERRKKWEEAELAKRNAKGKIPQDDKWKKRYKEPIEPIVDQLPVIPPNWNWSTVDQLASAEAGAITDGPFGSNLKTKHYTTSGPRVIRLQNIGYAEFINESAHISEKHFSQLRKHAVLPDDVIIAALGRPAPRACLVPGFLGKAIVKADCIRFRVAVPHVIPDYVMYALNSEPIQKRTENVIHGVGRPRLNLNEIKSIVLPLSPQGEQAKVINEIERCWSSARETEIQVEANLLRTERLRQSILERAFSGNLVPQDPKDEPAWKLLERIKAEREKAKENGSKKRRKRKKAMAPQEKFKERRDILAVLNESDGFMRPEDLFRLAGYKPEDVEDFYADLKKADQKKAISQVKKKNGDVFLKAMR